MGGGRGEAAAVTSLLLGRGVLLGVELPFVCPFVSGVSAGVEEAEGEPFVAGCMARSAGPFAAELVSDG